MNFHQEAVTRSGRALRRRALAAAVPALFLLLAVAPHGRGVMAAEAPGRALSVGGLPVT